MSEGGGNGVSNGARLRLTSHGGRNGEILIAESEVTRESVKDGAVKGDRVKDLTALSSDLSATGGPAVADRPGAILNLLQARSRADDITVDHAKD